MTERHFSDEDIVKILADLVLTRKIKSDRDPKVEMILAKLDKRYVGVFINSETNKCITLRPLRENEKVYLETGEWP